MVRTRATTSASSPPKAAAARIRKRKTRAPQSPSRSAAGADDNSVSRIDPTAATPARSCTSSTRTANRTTPRKRTEEEQELADWLEISGRVSSLPKGQDHLRHLLRISLEKKKNFESGAAAIHQGVVKGSVLCATVDSLVEARDIVGRTAGVHSSRIIGNEDTGLYTMHVLFRDDVSAIRATKKTIRLKGGMFTEWIWPPAGNRNFVSDISRILTFSLFSPILKETDIRELFELFLTEKIEVMGDGSAVVKFSSMSEADKCGEFFNGYTLFGTTIFSTQFDL